MFIVIPGTSLYRGSLHRGSTVGIDGFGFSQEFDNIFPSVVESQKDIYLLQFYGIQLR